MKRFFSLSILTFSLIFVQFLFATEIVILSIQGSVEVQKKGETTWQKIKTGSILKTGDRIRTGKKSQAVSVTKEGHKITIRQNTLFLISKLGPVEWDFEQELGKARLKVAKLASGQSLRVKTPTAVCAVRGTEFEVTVLEDKSTVLDVFEGSVGFADLAGIAEEMLIRENQRSVIQEGGAPAAPQAIPEAEPEGREEGRIPPELKNEIVREVSFDLDRENIEAAAAFELQAAQYQEAKTLIDAFGRRVRLEEYITRPTPESFKFVSLNTREDRFDFGFFEVVANKPLPDDLSVAGNLWFSDSATKPEFYAVKQRWFVTNTMDSVAQMQLDGDSREVTFREPLFRDGQFVNLTDKKGWQTVFDNQYEFINGNPTALEKIWTDSTFRPTDNGLLSGINVTGMMWHTKPVLISHTIMIPNPLDPFTPITQTISFYEDRFITRTGSPGGTGKMVVRTFEPGDDPFKAHFREKMAYINFVDNVTVNGRYDSGETLFSDLNRNGTLDSGEPSGMDPFVVAQQPWAWQTADYFVIDDFGKILNLRDVGFGHLAAGEQDKDAIADLFEKVNFERVWKSSEFSEPDNDIDVVMSPSIFLKAGLIEARTR